MVAQANQSGARKRNADQIVHEHIQRLKDLKRESKGMSAADLKAMETKINSAEKSIQKEMDAIREEFGRQLGRQAVETRNALREVRRLAEGNKSDLEKLRREIVTLEKRMEEEFRRWNRDLQNKRKRALLLCDQLDEHVKAIQNLYPEKYELLYPDQLHPGVFVLQSGLASILECIEGGNYEAGIGLALSRLPEAISIQGQFEHYHETYQKTNKEASDSMNRIRERIRSLNEPKETNVASHGWGYTDKYGISYWARELYAEVESRLELLEAQRKECEKAHDSEGLSLIIQAVQELNDKITDCETIEMNERMLHYECCGMAKQIMDVLNQNDGGVWELQETHINEEDRREPVYAVLSRPEGDHITVACIPERSEDPLALGDVHCEIEAFDRKMEKEDISRCRIVLQNAVTVLASNGIAIGDRQIEESQSGTKDAFVQTAIYNEGQARSKWLGQTKEVIGLN